MKNKIHLPEGIENIALSFSGGGFRAAVYSLGCLSYLNNLPYREGKMLDKVSFISSASGGSITAMTLVQMLNSGQSFDKIYHHLLDELSGTKLIDEVFNIFKKKEEWALRPHKNVNLINAFAIVYDKSLFREAKFSVFLEKNKPAKTKVIPEETKEKRRIEICINATEFNNGQLFRFTNSGIVGNSFLSLSTDSRRKSITARLKLGDILACSSCFPGGFEPVVYPKDFTYQENNEMLSWQDLSAVVNNKSPYSNPNKKLSESLEMFTMMDGGIDDNQGIDAFLNSKNRTTSAKYDLYLTCDVSSNYMTSSFSYPQRTESAFLKHHTRGILSELENSAWIYFGLALTLVVGSVPFIIHDKHRIISAIILGFASAMIILPILSFLYLKPRIKKVILSFAKENVSEGETENKPGTWSKIFKRYKGQILQFELTDLLRGAQVRLSSLSLLAQTVFLKKIRRSSYNMLFESNRAETRLIEAMNKGIPPQGIRERPAVNLGMTAIYLLSTKNDPVLQKELKGEPWVFATAAVSLSDPRKLSEVMQPSPQLRSIIDKATEMETTLWFDDYHLSENVSESLLVAGQATMCFNMLRMVYRISNNNGYWKVLKRSVLADWDKFKSDPQWMIRRYDKGIQQD